MICYTYYGYINIKEGKYLINFNIGLHGMENCNTMGIESESRKPDKHFFLSIKLKIFSYQSVLTNVLGVQKNWIIEMVLLSTHNICFG